MDKAQATALPSYDPKEAPSNEELPSYSLGPSSQRLPAFCAGSTLTIDPTGMFVSELPIKDVIPLYSLSTSLLNVNSLSSVHISRLTRSSGGETSSVAVYAIGDRFISPLHNRKQMLQDITVTCNHGLLTMLNLRETEWNFSTNVPDKNADIADERKTVPVIMQVSGAQGGPPPGMEQKSLLRYYIGKWIDDDDKLVALVRDGGEAYNGMPVLSMEKDLDLEMMDFLVSAWCVTMWEELGKRVRHMK